MTDDWIDALLARVEGWSPGFSATLEGADEAEIVAFEQALGRPAPSELRSFLVKMGRAHGGLIGYGPELRFDVGALTKFAASEAHAPPSSFCVAAAPDRDSMAIYFDLRPGIEQPPLVRLGVIDGVIASYAEQHSFATMLYGFAFTTRCLPRYDYELALRSAGVHAPSFPDSPRGTWLPRFGWIAEQLGFVDLPGSGPWWSCVEGDDAAMMLFEAPGHAPDVRVAARERKRFGNLVELLCDNLELHAHPGSLRQPG